MRPQRNKQLDWSKPFKLISNKKQFDQMQTGEDLVISIQSKQAPGQAAAYKKQNIITPKIQIVERVTQVKPFAKINPNYIRLPQRLNLPILKDYELTQVDHVFVKTHGQKYKFKGKAILTPEFLSKTFIELQTKAGKDPVIPRNKGWMTQYLQRQYKDLHEWEYLDKFSTLVYNFWKNRRQQLKFPLLRALWRPNPEEFNHLLAFKPRQKEKRNLRKTTRVSQDEILAQLHDEFQIAKQTAQRIQMRQELRLKQVQVQLNMFHNQCKSLFGMPQFLTQITSQSRAKDRQKLKQSHSKLDRIKSRREQPIQVQAPVYYPSNLSLDKKLSLANFLSTVICECQPFGLSYPSLFQSKTQVQQPTYEPLIPIVQQVKMDEPFVNLRLERAGDYVLRKFQQEDDSGEMERVYQDVTDYQRWRVASCYIGDDDQFQAKELRKTIAASFKKFQAQLKLN